MDLPLPKRPASIWPTSASHNQPAAPAMKFEREVVKIILWQHEVIGFGKQWQHDLFSA